MRRRRPAVARARRLAPGARTAQLVEAMAWHASHQPGGDRHATLAGGSAGYFVAPGDAPALGLGLVEALTDAGGRAERAAAARVAAEDYYWDRLVHRFLRLYTLDS